MQENMREELISAYLDGDLSDDEAARVSQLLATDEDCQHTLAAFEELRAVIQTYPREELDRDLSIAVMSKLGIAHPPTPVVASKRRLIPAIVVALTAAAVLMLIV